MEATYSSKDILCRKCLEMDLSVQDLQAYLDHYVNDMPMQLRISKEEYQNRLRQCESCPNLIQFTCRLCGCYVQARAAKWQMSCPMPYTPRWIKVLPPNESY